MYRYVVCGVCLFESTFMINVCHDDNDDDDDDVVKTNILYQA